MIDVMDEHKLELGTPVRYGKKLVRRYGTNGAGERNWESEFTMYRDAWRQYPKDRTGIIVGKRTYANGQVSWNDYINEFAATSYFTVYLVVWDMKRAPDAVLLEDLTLVEA